MNRQYCSITTAGLFLLAFLALTVSLSAQVGTEGVDPRGSQGRFGRSGCRRRGYGDEPGHQPEKQRHQRFKGNFEILALPRGTYSVTASFTGFKTWSVERTELGVGSTPPAFAGTGSW